MLLWTKSVPATRVDLWVERLGAVVSPGQIAMVQPADRRNARLEIYGVTKVQGRELVSQFGGRARLVPPASWQPRPSAAPGRPLRIAGRLWVTGHEDQLPNLRAAHPGRPVLCIPAAMAFGTGEHATTAMCLRFLAGTARQLARRDDGDWNLLDLGTGSGILALAGRLLGARSALGLDNDPHAVRTARGNATLNGVRGVRFARADLLDGWQPDGTTWPLITANLFSALLTTLLPRIRLVLAKGGFLIASGILASQAADLEKALPKSGLELLIKRRRGKWTAFLIRHLFVPRNIRHFTLPRSERRPWLPRND